MVDRARARGASASRQRCLEGEQYREGRETRGPWGPLGGRRGVDRRQPPAFADCRGPRHNGAPPDPRRPFVPELGRTPRVSFLPEGGWETPVGGGTRDILARP